MAADGKAIQAETDTKPAEKRNWQDHYIIKEDWPEITAKRAEKPEITMIPDMFSVSLQRLLEHHNIPHKVYRYNDIPDGALYSITWMGEQEHFPDGFETPFKKESLWHFVLEVIWHWTDPITRELDARYDQMVKDGIWSDD